MRITTRDSKKDHKLPGEYPFRHAQATDIALTYFLEKFMTQQHALYRWLAVGLSIFLGAVSMNAAALETLTGAKAQNSPQAAVFLAYEKALLWDGIEAAAAHMTAERLANMRAQLKQFGEDGFKQMQTERRKSTPQGEARRKQIEKLVVDGNKAVLTIRDSPNVVSEAPLEMTKDGWKIAK